MTNIDEALAKFENYCQEIESYIEHDLSESDTRSKVIDCVLREVLGWQEIDITREGHLDSGFFDYKLTLPGLHIIVEAKKNMSEFQLPQKHETAQISSLLSGNNEIISQVRKYLIDVGTQYGFLTNGKQFIIGKFYNVDGTDWKKNRLLLFNGLVDIKKRFVEFYNNLSRFSVVENGGFRFLLSSSEIKGKTILSTLIDREKEISRNQISSDITPLIDQIFGEIYSVDQELDEEFIKECFIENKEIKKNRGEIEKLFDDLPPRLDNVIPARNIESITEQIQNEIDNPEISIKELRAPKPIIIVGSKGSGKTTFINYLFKQKLPRETLKSHPYVYYDFRKFYAQDKSFDPHAVSKEILDDIYQKYATLKLHSLDVLKRIYKTEIDLNNEGIWAYEKKYNEDSYQLKLTQFLESKTKDNFSHLTFLSRYLIRERRIRLLIVIDNADQFDINIQERVFLYATSLNLKANCGTIISLREGYYYRWRFRPPFDAFESNVYHITAPKYSEVLQKRIDYTLKRLSFGGKARGETKKGFRIEFDAQNILEFFSGLKNSLFSEKNSNIVDFLSYSTHPNIREGLRIFKLFLISGYTNVEEYILRERFSMQKTVTIPMHEFLKTIGLYNKLYYNHEISIISNLFYPAIDNINHFLKLRILGLLSSKFKSGGNIDKFVSYNDVVEEFINSGYNSSAVQKEIAELLRFALLDSDDIISDTDWRELSSVDFNISITPKGYYYLTELKNRFHYIDLVVHDTPIYHPDHFIKIKKSFPSAEDDGTRLLNQRLETVINFLEYLKSEEQKEAQHIISKYGCILDEIFENGLSADIAKIRERI